MEMDGIWGGGVKPDRNDEMVYSKSPSSDCYLGIVVGPPCRVLIHRAKEGKCTSAAVSVLGEEGNFWGFFRLWYRVLL